MPIRRSPTRPQPTTQPRTATADRRRTLVLDRDPAAGQFVDMPTGAASSTVP
jgi:hypothetical protein